MGWFIRGKIPKEEKNPINHFLIWLYKPVVDLAIRWRKIVIVAALLIVVWVFFPWNWIVGQASRLPIGHGGASSASASPMRAGETPALLWVGKLFPYQNIGSEFMPPLYEGDLLYMPTTFPGISPTKARELIQVTDRIIKSFTEVETL
jgi:Cu(I)/Ag(I) efflux system membrane protein CusA/SilA